MEIKKEKEAESKKRIAQVKKLKEEYKNIVGWIEIKDTHISYPVVQGKDNEFYLTHNYKGDNAERGAIFLDSNYNWNIKGNNLMIYGHYMINEEMFTDLTKYVEENYYKQHPIIRFTTDKEDTEYIIREQLNQKESENFKFKKCFFGEMNLPKVNLIVANFSLPFSKKEFFGDIWKKITNSLSDERIFCWKFFWKKRYMGKNKRKSNIFNRTRSQSSF